MNVEVVVRSAVSKRQAAPLPNILMESFQQNRAHTPPLFYLFSNTQWIVKYCVILNDWDWYIANCVKTMASFICKFWDMIKLSCSNSLPVLQQNSMFLNEYIAKKPPPTLHNHISGI
eukprot:sb/3476543/